jgi:hypothetical protein
MLTAIQVKREDIKKNLNPDSMALKVKIWLGGKNFLHILPQLPSSKRI